MARRQDGRGFYQRVKKAGGESEILTLDPAKMDYRPQQKARFASIEAGRAIEDTRERLRMLVGPILAGKEADKAQKLSGALISEMCLYAARRVPEISDSIVDVDRAMRWGFGWELGPFETWDAIGAESMAKQLENEGKTAAAAGHGAFRIRKKVVLSVRAGETSYFDLASKSLQARAAARRNHYLEVAQGARERIEKKFRREPESIWAMAWFAANFTPR